MTPIVLYRHIRKVVAWSFAACALVCNAFAQLNDTQIVASSTETLPIPLPSKDKEDLPKTISFDELSTVEIQKIRQELYSDAIFQRDLSGKPKYADANSGCMQWLYKIELKKNTWRPIGFHVGQINPALIKINGAYREFYVHLKRSLDGPTSRPTYYGSLSSADFQPLVGWSDYKKRQTPSLSAPSQDAIKKKYENHWVLDLDSSAYTISDRKKPCMHIDADCRRYQIKLDRVYWSIRQAESRLSKPIANFSEKFDLGVEDMCPWNLKAMIESNNESRVWGYASGVKSHGFPKNPPLLKAIEPYISNTPRKFK